MTSLASAFVVLGCGEVGGDTPSDGRSATGTFNLTITTRAAPGNEARTSTVNCGLSEGGRSCAAARALTANDFSPTPADQPCTQEYGGPETASVSGTVRGTDVDVRVSRTNGCQIERWEKLVAPFIDSGSP